MIICLTMEHKGKGRKAKNERNRKNSHRKTFVGQARNQREERSCCGVAIGVHRPAPVAHFQECYSKKGHTHAPNFVAVSFFFFVKYDLCSQSSIEPIYQTVVGEILPKRDAHEKTQPQRMDTATTTLSTGKLCLGAPVL